MGDGITAMHDDYNDYVAECQRRGVAQRTYSCYEYDKIREHEKEWDMQEHPEKYFKAREDHILGEN